MIKVSQDFSQLPRKPRELLALFPGALEDVKRNFAIYDDKIRGARADFIVEFIEAKVLYDGFEQEILIDSLRSELRAGLTQFYNHYFRLNALIRVADGVEERPGAITPEIIETAKAVPCDALVPNAEWIDRGRRRRCLCPLHQEKHASFCVDTDSNSWHCYGECGRGGDSIDLWRALHGGTFADAVRTLGGAA